MSKLMSEMPTSFGSGSSPPVVMSPRTGFGNLRIAVVEAECTGYLTDDITCMDFILILVFVS